MPRAYRPRLATGARASVAAKALGAKSWHLFRPGSFRSGPPSVILFMPDGTTTTMTLKEAEARASKQGE